MIMCLCHISWTAIALRWGTSRKSIFAIVIARKLTRCKQGNIDALISNLEENFKNGTWLPWQWSNNRNVLGCLVTLSPKVLTR